MTEPPLGRSQRRWKCPHGKWGLLTIDRQAAISGPIDYRPTVVVRVEINSQCPFCRDTTVRRVIG